MNIYSKSSYRMTLKLRCIIGFLCAFVSFIVNGQTQESAQQGESSAERETSQEVQVAVGPAGSIEEIHCLNGMFYIDKDKDGKGDKNHNGIQTRWCEGDPLPQMVGSDGDVYTLVNDNTDCNDDNKEIQAEAVMWYPDTDGDDYGDHSKQGILSCANIPNYAIKMDCDDARPDIKGTVVYYKDSDGDGYGVGNDKITHCGAPPTGYSAIPGDKDDTNYWIRLIDLPTGNQCSGPQSMIIVYFDEDKDGFGINESGQKACAVPEGYSTRNGDCDDNNPNVNVKIFYRDNDNDGFGDPDDFISTETIGGPSVDFIEGCKPPRGYVDNNLDNCINEKGPHNGCLVDENPNEKLNSIRSLNFDILGNLVSASKSYFDELGKPTQSQSYDIKNSKIWASQTLYDKQGRPALQTLSAPARTQILFEHKNNFIQNASNSNFTTNDFENNSENPSTLGVQANTVGYYYSANNTAEPYQDVTARPYSRTIYSELNPGAALKTIGGNKIDGKWKNGYVFSMPAGQELSKPDAFAESKYDTYKIIKTVSRDVHGIENVVFTDTDGNTLAAARSGGSGNRTSSVIIGEQGFVDIHIPVGRTGISIQGHSGILYDIFDLITEQKINTAHGSLPNGFYRIAVRDLNNYNANTSVTYPENYYDYSLNYYDKAGRLVKSKQPLQHLESTYTYNSLGQLESTKSPDEGQAWFIYRKDGQIRFSVNSKQLENKQFSYTNYDQRGRPIESGVFTDNDTTPIYVDPSNTVDPFKTALRNIKEDVDGLEDTTCSEIHHTVYDNPDNAGLAAAFGADTRKSNYASQSFVAGNVVKTQTLKPETTTTWYSYDIYGRVQWIVQQINGLQELKTIDYVYDQVTSQVTKVYYQKGASDQFIHRYTYDPADYSLTKVETSVNDTSFTEHATYTYYETGALKRTNIAQGLQGIDYVYNLQGALKSINHPSLDAANDPGGDANDLFGMIIDYNKHDYNRPLPNIKSANYGFDQYNGNIKGIRWNSDYNPIPGKEHTYEYTYNRNNWLQKAEYGNFLPDNTSTPTIIDEQTAVTPSANDHLPSVNNVLNSGQTSHLKANVNITLVPGFHAQSGSVFTAKITAGSSNYVRDISAGTLIANANGDYKVDNITYDANGNIQTLHRNKHTENGTGNAMDKLEYKYDTGNNKPNQLKQVIDSEGDVAGAKDIGTQTDTDNYVYNQIGQLVNNRSENITYLYNASGLVTEVKKGNQPLVKFFYNDKGHRVRKESYNPTNGSLSYIEHYVRDAAGTPMAIYRDGQVVENTIYGAGRLGVRKSDGTNVYQLTDHLGNVRAVVGRNPQGEAMAMTSATDYYPFGMPMPNRNLQGDYRYAYQGQEKDPETGKEAFELRLWDARIGRWLTTDPYGQFDSPYLGMHNNPISAIDPDGGFSWLGAQWFKLWHGGEAVKVENDYGSYYKVIGFGDEGSSIAVGRGAIPTRAGAIAAISDNFQFENQLNQNRFGNDRVSLNYTDNRFVALGHNASYALPSAKLANISKAASQSDELVTVYRGVNSSAGSSYTNALNGVVKSRGGIFGHSNVLKHNTALNGTVNSRFTSWTTDIDVALNFAFRTSGEGVLFTTKVPTSSIIKSTNLKSVNLFHKPGTIVSESEVLLKGTFKNLIPEIVKF